MTDTVSGTGILLLTWKQKHEQGVTDVPQRIWMEGVKKQSFDSSREKRKAHENNA